MQYSSMTARDCSHWVGIEMHGKELEVRGCWKSQYHNTVDHNLIWLLTWHIVSGFVLVLGCQFHLFVPVKTDVYHMLFILQYSSWIILSITFCHALHSGLYTKVSVALYSKVSWHFLNVSERQPGFLIFYTCMSRTFSYNCPVDSCLSGDSSRSHTYYRAHGCSNLVLF